MKPCLNLTDCNRAKARSHVPSFPQLCQQQSVFLFVVLFPHPCHQDLYFSSTMPWSFLLFVPRSSATTAVSTTKRTLSSIMAKLETGFLLNLLSKHLDSYNSGDLVLQLKLKIEKTEKSCLSLLSLYMFRIQLLTLMFATSGPSQPNWFELFCNIFLLYPPR